MLKHPFKVMVTVFIVAVLLSFVSISYAKNAQTDRNKSEPSLIEKADPLDNIDCAKMIRMGIVHQENLRAGRIRVHCGMDPAGSEIEEFAQEPTPAFKSYSPFAIGGVDYDVITGTTDTYPTVTQSEETVWGNGNTIFVAFNTSPAANCAGGTSYGHGSYSTDGGVTFTRLCPNPFGTGHGTNYGDPMVVYNVRLGKWYTAWLATGCGGQGIGMWESTNAINWTVGSCAHNGGSDDRESMWVDNNSGSPYYGRLYISYADYTIANTPLSVVYSDDGTTWTGPVVVYGAAPFHRDVQITGSPGTDGTVFIASMDENAGSGGCATNRTNFMYRSTNGGAAWSLVYTGPTFIGPGTTSCGFFCAITPIWRHMGWGQPAVGPAGTVHYDYAGANGTDAGNIYYIRSTDNGNTWSTPIQLNQDTTTYEQWMPSLVATPSGQVLASWYDRRNSSGGTSYQRYGRVSNNAGSSWQNDDTISDVITPQPLQPDGAIQSCYNGDYDYNSVNGTKALLTWADGRTLIGGNSQQDVYFDQVQLCTTVPNAPTGTTATPSAPNQITVTWNSVSGANCYNVYKSNGACPGSTFTIVSTCQAGTTYVDTAVSGGSTYSYKITSVITPSNCESAFSTCVQATATGICTLSPTFAGAAAVVNNQATTCGLTVQWAAGTSSCASYPTLTYTIYKSTDPAFVPGPSNQIATCRTGTTYADANVNYGTTYYYVVRAEDNGTGGSGPCNGGNFETNIVKKNGTPTGPPIPGNFSENVESGANGWTISSGALWHIYAPGTCVPPGYHSATHSWYYGQDATCNYDTSGATNSGYLYSPAIQQATTTSNLSFWYYRQVESYAGTYDITNVDVTGDGGTTWTNVWTRNSSNPSESAWTASGNISLSAFNGMNIQLRFFFNTVDGAANAFQGWAIDDVSVTNVQTPTSCTSGPSPAGKVLNNIKVTKTSGNPVLNWTAVTGTCTVVGYEIYRGNLPFTIYNHASLNCATTGTTYTDAAAPNSYYYLVVSYNSTCEGSYGTQFPAGTERPQGSSPCRTQCLGVCN